MGFIKYNAHPYADDIDDCVIRAISTFYDISWEQAYLKVVMQGYYMKLFPTNRNDVWGTMLHEDGCAFYYIPNMCPNCITVKRFASAEVANCNRSMANLERSFATQTAVTGAITDLASQQAQCCCENRLANCETRNTIVAESAATRNADLLNTRDIIDNQNRNNQAIIDKLCQLELDGLKSQLSAKDDVIGQLRAQLNVADRERSQSQQTADIIANNAAQSAALRELIAPQIKPTYIVPNPNGCNCGQTYTCGSF